MLEQIEIWQAVFKSQDYIEILNDPSVVLRDYISLHESHNEDHADKLYSRWASIKKTDLRLQILRHVYLFILGHELWLSKYRPCSKWSRHEKIMASKLRKMVMDHDYGIILITAVMGVA